MKFDYQQLRADLEAARKRECSWATGRHDESCDLVAGLEADLEAAREQYQMALNLADHWQDELEKREAENAALKKRIEELEHDKETDEILDTLQREGPGGKL